MMRILLIILFLFITSCGPSIIATYDGGKISQAMLKNKINSLPKNIKVQYRNIDKQKELLRQMVLDILITEEAVNRNLDKSDDLIQKLREYEESILAQEIFNKIKRPKVSLSFGDYRKYSSSLDIRLIWVKLNYGATRAEKNERYKKAKEILQLARAGNDFAELANKYTDDVRNFKGGDLGYFKYEDMVEPFSKLAFKLKKGEIGGPVKTQFGYHIIKVEDIQEKKGAEPKRIRARHILLKVPENATVNEDEAIKLKAIEILNQAKAGEDFSVLANKYSEDSGNRLGGKVPFTNFMDIYFPIADIAYKTGENKICNLLETKFGYFIIKVEKKTVKKDIKSLKKDEGFKRRVLDIKARMKSDIERTKLAEKLLSDNCIIRNYSIITNTTASSNDVIVKLAPNNLYFEGKLYNFEYKFGDLIKAVGGKINNEQFSEYIRYIEERILVPKLATISALRKGYDKKENFKNKVSEQKNRLLSDKLCSEIGSELWEQWKSELLIKKNFKIIEENLRVKKDENYYIAVGDRNLGEKKYKKALSSYRKANKINKNFIGLYPRISKVYKLLGDNKKAEDWFSRLRDVPKPNVVELLPFINDEDKFISLRTIEMLGIFGDRAVEKELIDLLLKTEDEEIKQATVKTLGFLKSEQAFIPIFDIYMQVRNDRKREVLKWYTIEALSYIGRQEVVMPFINMLSDNNISTNTKCFLIEALGRLKDKRAVPILEKKLKDKVWGVRLLASESLKLITGKDYPFEDKK